MNRYGSEQGQALIEFAFIIMVMALLALGVVDFALAIQQGMLVQEAATEGAMCGSFDTYQVSQTANAQRAATLAGIGAKGLTITTSSYCTCTPGGATIFCTNSCSGDKPMMYFQVTATSSFNSLFPYTILPQVFNLSSTVVMPVQ